MNDIDQYVDEVQTLFCKEIKNLRQKRGMSIEDISSLFLNPDGKTYSLGARTIANIENQTYNPKFKDILRLLYHLGGNPSTFLSELANNPREEEEEEEIRKQLNLQNYDAVSYGLKQYQVKYPQYETIPRQKQFVLWMEACLSHANNILPANLEAKLIKALSLTLRKITDAKGSLILKKLKTKNLTLQEYRIISALALLRGGEEAIQLYQLLYSLTENSLTISYAKRNRLLITLQYNISTVLLEIRPDDSQILEVCTAGVERSLKSEDYDSLGQLYYNIGRFHLGKHDGELSKKFFQRAYDFFNVTQQFEAAEKTFNWVHTEHGITLKQDHWA